MRLQLRNFILLALMLAASISAHQLKPSKYLSKEYPIGDIQQIIPDNFGDWELDKSASNVIVNPVLQETLSEIYNQTLSRTYVNSKGYRVMLSVAYGGDQSRELQVHRPEVCYAASGFSITAMEKVKLETPLGMIPAMQLIATSGARREPVTYWVRIGENIVRGNVEQGIARALYGFKGYIADGLLFRVSSIDDESSTAFSAQAGFVEDITKVISPEKKFVFFGNTQ